ncbi:MAG: hypothetical protein AAGK98_11920 [Pseudomonadota bacterium]
MRLHLHLGVHKTATTHIQHTLGANTGWLAARGRAAPVEADIQQIFQRPMKWALDPPVNWAVIRGSVSDGLRDASGAADLTILSFERFLGPLRDLFARDALYPEAPTRLAALAGLLRDHEVCVFLALRDYGAFAASAYCEALRWGPFFPFDAVREDLLREGLLDWRPLVGAVQDAFGPDAVRLWRYEDYANAPAPILRTLLDLTENPTTEVAAQPRVRYSAAAVALMGREATALPPRAHPRRIAELAEEYPVDGARPGFDPWTAEEAGLLSTRYAAHLSELPAPLFLPSPDRA